MCTSIHGSSYMLCGTAVPAYSLGKCRCWISEKQNDTPRVVRQGRGRSLFLVTMHANLTLLLTNLQRLGPQPWASAAFSLLSSALACQRPAARWQPRTAIQPNALQQDLFPSLSQGFSSPGAPVFCSAFAITAPLYQVGSASEVHVEPRTLC